MAFPRNVNNPDIQIFASSVVEQGNGILLSDTVS